MSLIPAFDLLQKINMNLDDFPFDDIKFTGSIEKFIGKVIANIDGGVGKEKAIEQIVDIYIETGIINASFRNVFVITPKLNKYIKLCIYQIEILHPDERGNFKAFLYKYDTNGRDPEFKLKILISLMVVALFLAVMMIYVHLYYQVILND